MKYERLKWLVASAVLQETIDIPFNAFALYKTALGGTALFSPADASELGHACFDKIMEWDIRSVESLRTFFPHYFPKSLGTGTLYPYMGDNGVWYISNVAI